MSDQTMKNNVEIQTNNNYKKKFENLTLDNIRIHKRTLLSVLIDYNNKAVDRVDEFFNQRRINLEINLTILLITLTIVTVILDTLNSIEVSILVVILVIYFGFLLVNLIYNLLPQKTQFEKKEPDDFFWITPRFFRGNISEYKKENIPGLTKELYKFAKNFGLKEESNDQNKVNDQNKSIDQSELDLRDKLIKDEIKNLFELFWFQAHYFKMANFTRTCSLFGTFFIIASMILLLSLNPFFP